MRPAPDPIPVTLLAGFLGAGKTTLLNRILAECHGERVAVIVNEYGAAGIDGRLVVGVSDELVELANGCVCCTVRGDLSRTLRRLLARRRAPDRVLIETSGLASPGPAAQTLLLDSELAGAYRLVGVLTMAHAANLPHQFDRHPEVAEQLAYADVVVLNHIDRTDSAGRERARSLVRRANALAQVLETTRADLPLAELLTPTSAFDTARAARVPPVTHSSGVSTVALRARRPLDLHALKMWLRFVASRRGQDLYRAKGLLHCAGHAESVVVQAMYEWMELGPGVGPAPEESLLVLIGDGLDGAEIERGWEACLS